MIRSVHARETEMACHHGSGYHDLILLLCTVVSVSHPLSFPYHAPQPHVQDIHSVPAVSISVEPDHFLDVFASGESVWKALLEIDISSQLSGVLS